MTAEVVQVETGSDGTALLRTTALVALRAASPGPTVTGVRARWRTSAWPRPSRGSPRIALASRSSRLGGGTVSGVLEAVGLDVLVVRPETQHSTPVYVPVDGVDEVIVEPPA